MSDQNVTTPDEQPDGPYETVPGEAQPAEGTVEGVETPDEPSVEEQASEDDNPLAGLSMDEVVSALLQGKFSTDAAEQRRRLEAAGYDADEVAEAVRVRLNQRYE